MTVDRATSYTPDLVLPPGETLAEVLDDRGMSQTELATRTGLSTKHISQIVNGSATITPDTALLLERATGVPARIWGGLEVAYRDHLSRQQDEARLEGDLDWLDELPLREMARRGLIPRPEKTVSTLRAVCEFFGVANHSAWEALWIKPTAYRTSRAFTSDPGAIAVWLRLGERQAAAIDCQPFSRKRLTSAVRDLRALTREPDPAKWHPALTEILASTGVVVVIQREVAGGRINGAARWLSPNTAMVQLSLRHRWNDIFWFTLFHELGHLLIHSKKEAFLNDVGAHSGVELEADAFASQTLIPRAFEPRLADVQTDKDAASVAKELGIAPGIVVGRLQHDGRWPYSKGNQLKQRFIFRDT